VLERLSTAAASTSIAGRRALGQEHALDVIDAALPLPA
jgi:hypothetical protein